MQSHGRQIDSKHEKRHHNLVLLSPFTHFTSSPFFLRLSFFIVSYKIPSLHLDGLLNS